MSRVSINTYSLVFDRGIALVDTISEVLSIVNAKCSIQCTSCISREAAYVTACQSYASRFWRIAQDGVVPMPPIELFEQAKVFEDCAGRAPWRYQHPRFFAILSEGLAPALLLGIEQLAGYLREGMPMLLMEFADKDCASMWLTEQIYVRLITAGAYIRDVGPIILPGVGETAEGCAPRFLPGANSFLPNGNSVFHGESSRDFFLALPTESIFEEE